MAGCCCEEKALKIFKNYPTEWDSIPWLSILFESKAIDLTGFHATFTLGDFRKEWTDLTDGIIINLTDEETGALPIGLNYATLIVEDASGNSKPFSTAIHVEVLTWVEGDQELDTYNMTVNALLDNETQMVIKIETAKVSLDWVEEKIAEHNEDETAHRFIQQNLAIESIARANAVAELQERKQDKLIEENAGDNISITEVGGVIKINSTAQGLTVHNQLTGRDSANAHPICSITGLQSVLDGKATESDIQTNIQQHNESTSAHSDIREDVSTIESYIPNGTSTTNQLATESFVNSSVQTATANFRGNWNTWDEIPTDSSLYPVDDAGSTVPTTNDYLIVNEADDYPNEELTGRWRFKYSGVWATNGKNGWHPEYQVNEEPFTDAQVKAIDSTITKEKVESYSAHVSNNDIHVTSSDKTNWNNKQNAISDLNDIRAGAVAGATALQPSELNGYATEQWVGQQGYLTIETLPIYDGSSE